MSAPHQDDTGEHEDEFFELFGGVSLPPAPGLPAPAAVFPPEAVHALIARALGELSPICETCEAYCPDHTIRVRDAFLARAGQLLVSLGEGLDLYFRSRKYGISEPDQILDKLFETWSELYLLYPLADPRIALTDDEDEELDELPDFPSRESDPEA